ncbi:MAG: hypothetical protein M1816_005349 [Peltula sp. TS41687]|nr:MAG: hypothetical protein M1816_005349 [Peltula sp. TS41687]
MSKRRTIDNFFQASSKKARTEESTNTSGISTTTEVSIQYSTHSTYPFPIPHLPLSIASALITFPAVKGKEINDEPDLDLLYFQPYIPKSIEAELFKFLRRSLFFYRVEYKIQRGNVQTQIRTPRFTTVFGVDSTSSFTSEGTLIDSVTNKPVPSDRYKSCKPRPIPQCLDEIRKQKTVEQHLPNTTFNFCLVNYYASGADSISYHSDDEQFLGANPSIASFSLGASRDFLMKHKPTTPHPPNASNNRRPIKFPLQSGDMILMRGPTQSNWLHSIPKRSDGGRGRINITFRKALVRGGTENYYRYNVGAAGRPWRWDEDRKEMRVGESLVGKEERPSSELGGSRGTVRAERQ